MILTRTWTRGRGSELPGRLMGEFDQRLRHQLLCWLGSRPWNHDQVNSGWEVVLRESERLPEQPLVAVADHSAPHFSRH